jgi:hypothetical protein
MLASCEHGNGALGCLIQSEQFLDDSVFASEEGLH